MHATIDRPLSLSGGHRSCQIVQPADLPRLSVAIRLQKFAAAATRLPREATPAAFAHSAHT